nr:hypothetical protein [Tanacetum cinerariifolium]
MAKEIWKNVELLMQGPGLTKQQQKETLFNQYERFRANGNESIHDYFVRFYKLINDMKIYGDPSSSEEYQSYEQHAMKTLSKMNQTFGNANPLAYMAQATQSSSYTPSQYVPLPPQYAPAPQQAPQTSTNPMTKPTIQAGQITTYNVQRRAPGHVAKECKEKKRAKDSQWFKDKAFLMEAKEKGAILDVEAEAFLANVKCTTPYAEPLAITTTTKYKTGPSTGQGTNNDTDFHSKNVKSYLEELVCLRNTNKVVTELLQSYGQPVQIVPMLSKRPTFPTKDLHKSALGHSNPLYLKTAHLCRPSLYLGDVIIDPVHNPFRVYDSEETLVQAEVSRTKMLERMKDPLYKVSSKPINYAKLNSLYDTFMPQKQLSREQVYGLPANEVASYNCNQSKPVTNFVCTRPAKSQVNTQLKMLKACFPEFDKVFKDKTTPSYITNGEWHFEHTKKCFVEEIIPFYEKLKRHVKGIEDNLFKEVSEYMKIFNELDKEYDQCVIDKCLEIENKNLLIQNECLLAESVSKDICFVMLTFDIAVLMSVEPRSNCVKEHSRNLELEVEILKSKAESNSNVSSGAAVLEKPKVLAPGLYAITPKITKPDVVPLEKSRSVSTSEPAINVTVTPRFSAKTLTSYKRKDRKIKDTSTGSPPNAETQAVNDHVNVNDLFV